MFKLILVCALLMRYNFEAAKLNAQKTRVCIIGAGLAGLSTARYLEEEGIDYVILEATQYIGGTWRYDERVGLDENGQPIHTSMYKHLRTNLPKSVMESPNFPLPEDSPSFLTRDIFLEYLKSFAKHFNVEKNIKFLHQVTSVKRQDNVWKVKYRHVRSGDQNEEEFDYVIVATGHHSKPNMPNIPGEKLFKGTIIHSHDYRETEPYKCRRVLVIGAGPSGLDIGLDVASVSKTLFHSHHSRINFRTPFPANYIKKSDVRELNETGALFVDGTYEEIDDVIYCTGFEYYYPFLDESSGLTVTNRVVYPLHKIVLNINQPTMFVMGAVTRTCLVIALDAQARYAIALIKGDFIPPSRELMLKELEDHYNSLRESGRPPHFIHVLGEKQDKYFAELTQESGIRRVPPVISKIYAAGAEAMFANLYTFRNYVYTVIDDETFTKTLTDDTIPKRNVTCTM